MPRPSTIDRLPKEVRELIGRLREDGRTLDEILAKLDELRAEVSRSALGRHVQKLDRIGERIRRSRAMADALVARFGDAPESRTARMNIELMHSIITDLVMAVEGGENGEGTAITLDPENAMFLARSLDHLAKAAAADALLTQKIRDEAAKKAAAAAVAVVEKTGREKGLSADTISAIKTSILGVKGA